jgi:hypothetical protein
MLASSNGNSAGAIKRVSRSFSCIKAPAGSANSTAASAEASTTTLAGP